MFNGKSSRDWELFRGNEQLSGYTSTLLPEKPELLWSYKAQSRTVSSPVVLDGVTYWSDRRGKVLGVDLSGEQVFNYNLNMLVEATPMIRDSVLYVGTIEGRMVALSLTKCDTLWTFETWGQISASPNHVDFEGRDAIVFGSYDNYLYSIDQHDGKPISQFESGYYLNGAVALWDKYVIFGGCDQWIRVINCETGIQTDSLLLDAYIPCSPAIDGNHVYVGDYSGNIYELQMRKDGIAKSQKLLEATDDDGDNVSVPAIDDNQLYVFTGSRYLTAVDRNSGNVKWRQMLKGNVGESSPVVCRDKVIACTKTGIISIFRAKDGELLWEYDAGEDIVGSPAIIKDHFLILTVRGTLLCFGNKR
ncbi:MAG: PQQ-binding-like beta-propeller repeat protein [Bacteroidaceae bacterium]|nr:PQQ-binding-like beta-propeller repeat protein [Bacteroidaceae bacterium]